MGSGLAEQIAVLDGLDNVAKPVMPGVQRRTGVIDASAGANYSGGSSYAPGIPLLPSSVGLAELQDFAASDLAAAADSYAKMTMPGVQERTGVIDASEGGNYSGGSSYAPGIPLLPSTVGLAGIPSVLPTRKGVIDPSVGANYSGGSSYAPGIPLLSSSAGLAALDQVDDATFTRRLKGRAKAVFKKVASRNKLGSIKKAIVQVQRAPVQTPMQQQMKRQQLQQLGMKLNTARVARASILTANTINGVPVFASRTFSPSNAAGRFLVKNEQRMHTQRGSTPMMWK